MEGKAWAALSVAATGCRRLRQAVEDYDRLLKKPREPPMIFDMEKPKGREAHNLVIGLVAPRPIALVTRIHDGRAMDAAPARSYNELCADPPLIGIGDTN